MKPITYIVETVKAQFYIKPEEIEPIEKACTWFELSLSNTLMQLASNSSSNLKHYYPELENIVISNPNPIIRKFNFIDPLQSRQEAFEHANKLNISLLTQTQGEYNSQVHIDKLAKELGVKNLISRLSGIINIQKSDVYLVSAGEKICVASNLNLDLQNYVKEAIIYKKHYPETETGFVYAKSLNKEVEVLKVVSDIVNNKN